MKLRIIANMKTAEGKLSHEEKVSLKHSFNSGTAAEALNFILERYLEFADLVQVCQELSEESWKSLTLKGLTIQLFYRLLGSYTSLDVNEDTDLSVNYWVTQAFPIMEKLLADSTNLGD